MKFYKENNINPAASCLPLLAQFPIFIALFYVLRDFAKEADKPGNDLGDLSWLHVVPSVADNVLEPLVGLPAALHLRGEPDRVDVLHVRDDGQDAALDHDGAADRFIPLIANFPTGLVLYWMTTNLWTVGQGLVTRRLAPKPVTPPETHVANAAEGAR